MLKLESVLKCTNDCKKGVMNYMLMSFIIICFDFQVFYNSIIIYNCNDKRT